LLNYQATDFGNSPSGVYIQNDVVFPGCRVDPERIRPIDARLATR
jgi:hypothetical protein